MRRLRLLFLAGLSACAGTAAPIASAVPLRPACAADDERLVVDWSPLDRSKLEAAARHGVVPVHVDGCRARIVDGCSIRRPYTFVGTSRQREILRLSDHEEIEGKLPILAARFGASVARATSLDVAMTVVGRYESGTAPIAASELDGDCGAVTHVVTGLSVGAFTIGTDSTTTAEASVDLARAGHASERRHLDAAGLEAACAAARRADAAPPDDCSVPLRAELRALRAPAEVVTRTPSPAETDSDAMRRAMTSATRELGWCHRVARATSPDLSGALTLLVKLAQSGHVRSVTARPEGNLDDSLAACAVERVGHVLFPAAAPDETRARTIVIPVLFRPLAR